MQNKNNRSNKPKPVTLNVVVSTSGADRFGNEYNVESVHDLLAELQEHLVFEKLTVSVNCARALIIGDENAKGTMPVARVKSYADGAMDLVFRDPSHASIVDMNNLVVVPRLRIDRNTHDAITITGLDLIKATEA